MISAPTSYGELIDKITILEIKQSRMTSPHKLRHIEKELSALARIRDDAHLQGFDELNALTAALRLINQTLWDIEDAIRRCENERNFGPTFVELARSVYKENDKRAAVKRRINELLGSDLVEEKSYACEQSPSIPPSLQAPATHA